jgi:hypothetical protein
MPKKTKPGLFDRQFEKIYRVAGLCKALSRLTANRQNLGLFKNAIHERDRVIIVGSGPSCETFDFARLENAVVILINHAIDLACFIPSNNSVYWFTADSERAEECLGKVPERVTPLVAVHDYANFSSMNAFVNSSKGFFIPFINWRTVISRGNVSPLRVTPGHKIPDTRGIDFGFIPYLLGGTSLLPILYIVLMFDAREIVIIGVDLDESQVGYDHRITTPDEAKENKGFNHKKIASTVAAIQESAKERGKVFSIESHGKFELP